MQRSILTFLFYSDGTYKISFIVSKNPANFSSQIGPEKGVAHLAAAAILNSLWDLWARLENKPLWRLLVDMKPEVCILPINPIIYLLFTR